MTNGGVVFAWCRRSLWIVVGMMAAIAVVVVLRPDGGGGSSLRYPNPVRADTDDVTAQAIGVIQGVHGVGPLLKAPPVSVPQPGDPPQVEVPAPAKQTPAESTQQAQQQQQQPAPPAPPAPPTPQNRPQDKPQPPAQSPVQPPHNALQALPVNVSPRCAAVRPPLPKGVPVNSVLLTDAKFQAMLSRVASSNCDVIVTAGNYGFLPMLTNLVNTSIRRFQLDFFLIVGLDDRVCAALPSDVPCYTYPETFASGNFGSAAFSKLVNIKTEIVMAIAASGYNSLLVDGDIVFKKNPFTVLTPQAPLFDLQIQDDAEGGRNSGFMYTQRTALGLEFLATSLNVASRTKNMRQQPAVNAALGRMQSRLRVKVLPTSQFPCGKAYFERPRRMFAFDNPCTECVIVHDNWVRVCVCVCVCVRVCVRAHRVLVALVVVVAVGKCSRWCVCASVEGEIPHGNTWTSLWRRLSFAGCWYRRQGSTPQGAFDLVGGHRRLLQQPDAPLPGGWQLVHGGFRWPGT